MSEASAALAKEAGASRAERAVAQRRARTVTVLAVAIVGLAGLVWFEWGSVRHSFTVLGHAPLYWIRLAIFVESVSMVTMARMQRRLLRAGGVRLPINSMLGIVYASNSISVSIPIAGSPMSAAFSFRAFARRGADRNLAGWALAMSGVISSVTFALIVSVGAIVSGNVIAAVLGVLAGSATVVPVLTCLVAIRNDRLRAPLAAAAVWSLRLVQRIIHRPEGEPRELVDLTIERVRGLRLRGRGWAFVFWLATVNWVGDIACLAVSIMAVGSPVPWSALILVWSVGLGAASFGITPGGLGVVEAALAAALVAAGVHSPQAVAAVLVYRLISFWLVDAVGWALYGATRKRTAPVPSESASSA